MKLLFNTAHLDIREFNEKDAPFIFELLNTPLWLQFIGDRNIHSVADAEQFLKNGYIFNYSKIGYSFYKVNLKDSFHSVGLCGFAKRDYLDHPDIGFAFLPEYYGKGFGFEAASAMLEYGFKNLVFNKIQAIVNTENEASVALIKKLGLTFVKTIIAPNDSKELMLFSIEKQV
jgi:[ribosomal protein S5]-alanine N-acetyltransferase